MGDSIIIDEIDTCLDIVAQHEHKRFKPSRYFRNKCVRHYMALKKAYDENPMLCACHVVYSTGKKCGNYISEQFILITFHIDKITFRGLTQKINTFTAGHVSPVPQAGETEAPPACSEI